MDRREVSGPWEEIRADLTRARGTLGSMADADAAIRSYRDFEANNELELACDSLADYGEAHAVTTEFWLALRDAAAKMRLGNKVVAYERHAATIDEN